MTTIVAFLLVLGFLIFIHEMGHYLAARHVGVRVQAFSIGFPPKLIGKQIGETEYCLSWLPVGGYVQLYGQNMHDEDPDDPRNYAAKSILQRLYILVAGPAMNLLVALLFMPLVYWVGVESPGYLFSSPVVHQVRPATLADELGVQPGDEILSVNGQEATDWRTVSELVSELSPDSPLTLELYRNGAFFPVTGVYRAGEIGWVPRIPPVVGTLLENSAARESGIVPGDRILRINDQLIQDWNEISPTVQALQQQYRESAEDDAAPQPLRVEVERDGEQFRVGVTPSFDPESGRYLLGMTLEMKMLSFSFGEAVQRGVGRLLYIVQATFSFLGQVISGQGSMDDVGGPLRIGQVIGEAAESGWTDLFFLTAIISLQLGIFNLLPIPALDGGHIFLLLIEKFKGSPLSAALRERTQMVGFSVLIALMLFVTYNDLLQLFFKLPQ